MNRLCISVIGRYSVCIMIKIQKEFVLKNSIQLDITPLSPVENTAEQLALLEKARMRNNNGRS